MSVWRHTIPLEAGYLFSLSDSLRIAEDAHGDILTPTSDGPMLIASDYSGQHKEATHEAYSFLVTTEHALMEWLPALRDFRKHWLPDNRSISYKKLNEPARWRALPAFLETASSLRGNLITIMIDRKAGSFMEGGPEAIANTLTDCFPPNANRGTTEKMFRLASFISLIMAGLRREDQTSIWISDHDETLETHDRREQFARLSAYITFSLTGWRKPADSYFCTTESPHAPPWAEDIAALADLAAGSYCHLSSFLPAYLGKEAWITRADSSSIENQRARAIAGWLATQQGNLRHVLLRLERGENKEIRSSAQAFSPAQALYRQSEK